MNYLTIGTLWKSENSYALDFIKYHRYVGVEKFIILDRENTTLPDLLKNEKDVEIHHYPDIPGNIHSEAWAKLIGMMKDKTKFLALIDADQALVPVKTDDVRDILKKYENFASLQCNWVSFGAGGQIERTSGSLYERFTDRAKLNEGINAHTQFICNPNRTLALKVNDPHHPRLPPNEVSVSTDYRVINGPFINPPIHDTLYIAHYISKSFNEWKEKNLKGRADIFGEKMPFNMFEDHEKILNAEKETRVLELWNKANGKI